MASIVRRQAAGSLRTGTGQTVRVWLAATSRTRLVRNESIQWASTPTRVCPVCRALRVGMGVVSQLCFRQRRSPDSAGKIF